MPASVSKLCLSSDGTQIYAEASGNPANPSIVLAYGFALSGIVFDKLFSDPRMLKKLYLVRYDMCGHGQSGKPNSTEGYASSLYVADFAAVVVEFSLHMPVFVGWSAGAPIISDICSHISPVPLISAITLSGPLCVATAGKTLKPKLLELLHKFVSPDVATVLETRVEFINACFANPENVPFADKAAWIRSTVLQGPKVPAAMRVGYKPDQTELVALGQGFPAMILYGTEDQIQDGAVAAAEARPYFTDLEVVVIEGRSHLVFYDNLDETVGHILVFCLHVNSQGRPAS
ncbi:alpha/beta-hydrolase [Mycena olivaceomarginata]|nr:alpha/beta-hydrolase [Mycena olivaceomarginata]